LALAPGSRVETSRNPYRRREAALSGPGESGPSGLPPPPKRPLPRSGEGWGISTPRAPTRKRQGRRHLVPQGSDWRNQTKEIQDVQPHSSFRSLDGARVAAPPGAGRRSWRSPTLVERQTPHTFQLPQGSGVVGNNLILPRQGPGSPGLLLCAFTAHLLSVVGRSRATDEGTSRLRAESAPSP
jgi:hypothetical protein